MFRGLKKHIRSCIHFWVSCNMLELKEASNNSSIHLWSKILNSDFIHLSSNLARENSYRHGSRTKGSNWDLLWQQSNHCHDKKNQTYHGRTKHIDIQVHFIWDLGENGTISIKYYSSSEQVINILTKSIPQGKHVYFRSLLGVCNFASKGSAGN